MARNNIKHNIWTEGGRTGGIISDASAAPVTLTGLEATYIEVLSATTFTSLTGWDSRTATAYTFSGVNVPTGIATVAGAKLGAGYGRKFTAITHTGGQIAYYDKIED